MWLSRWGEAREGLAKFYYSNDNLAITGNYKGGKKEGIWEFYDEDGKLTKKVNYVNDDVEEEVVYWNNRIKIRKKNLKDGRKVKKTIKSRKIF